ncbi:MAG: phage scaffolding protein [Caldisphaeraceae archaeon]|nr:phage scaffolding protein [Caldisphaeraceae archaeon]
MTETHSSNKKPVTVVVLVIIIVIIATGWGYTYYHYKSELNKLSQSVGANTTSNLESKINNLESQISTYKGQVSQLESQISTYKGQVSQLESIVNLNLKENLVDHKTVNEQASSYAQWTFNANYAGYIVVTVQSSTTTKTYAEVIYNSYGTSFDEKVPIGSSGSAVFPVLPGNIEIRVGNNNVFNGATQVVSITYYY